VREVISCGALRRLMESGEDHALLDIREQGEYSAGHIPGATSLPRAAIEFRMAELVPVRSTAIVVVGDAGSRAGLAAETLRLLGYENTLEVAGGLPSWVESGFPTATGVNVPSKEFGEKIHLEERVPEIEPEELCRLASRTEAVLILDARTPEEYRRFCIPGGVSVPGGDLILWATDLMKDPRATVVVNCAGRTRSLIGTQTLRRLGLMNAFALKNGTMGWLLAGLTLELKPGREAPAPSPLSRGEGEKLASRIAIEEKIARISTPELQALLAQRGSRTLYPIDVRSSEQYLSGHIPGFLWIPGGQAVQRTDDYVAVRSGTIVFASDRTARATMAAYWYKKMGFKNVRVLDGGVRAWSENGLEIEQGEPAKRVLGLDRARGRVRCISPEKLAALVRKLKGIAILDVGTSAHYSGGHIPGAYWISRGWLEEKIADVLPDRARPIVVTCPGGDPSTLAAATLMGLGYDEVSVLEGGTERWKSEGRALEEGLTRPLVEANDLVVSASVTGDLQAMQRYLDWEIALGGKHRKG